MTPEAGGGRGLPARDTSSYDRSHAAPAPRESEPMMSRPFRTSARALAAVSFAFVAGLPAAAHAAGDPGPVARAYLDLRAAAGKATKPEALLPHLSSSYRRIVNGLPSGERDEWFQRFKRFPPTPVTIQAQAVAGDRGALGAVARDAAHVKWSGRIEMVREGGAWKLDDETWSSEHR